MPSGKVVKPPPTFSFINLGHEATETSWLKIHSGAARRHAAYWSGSGKHRRQSKTRMTGQQISYGTSLCNIDKDISSFQETTDAADETVAPFARRRGFKKRKDARAITSLVETRLESPRYVEYDNLRYFPAVPSGISAIASSFVAGKSIFKFCGESFVTRYFTADHEDNPIMFSAYLLLSYAHNMALTGHGSKTVLLQLKGQVIHLISSKMISSHGLLSPRCLTAILALGAPIVSLISQELPKSLSMLEYINVSGLEDFLCCEFAHIAHSAHEERTVHWNAMRKLFYKSNASFQDAESLTLLRYVSNCMNM
jgi:hypothetical protein